MTGFTKANKWTPFFLAALMLTAAAGQRADAQRRGGPDANSPSRELIFSEAFRIGDETAGDSVLLGYVFTMAVDSKGQLYLTDSGFKGIRMFSSNGILIREIGREGKGPGEFAAMPSVHIGPGDSLYALDRTAARITIFSPQDQSLVTTVSVLGPGAPRPAAFLGASRRGLLVEFTSYYTPGSESLIRMSTLVKHVHWNGTVAPDTIAQLPITDFVVFDIEGAVGIRFLPYAASPHFAFSADQVLYYGMGDAINITIAALDGATRHKISLPHMPVFVTRAEREAAAAGVRHGGTRKKLLTNIPANKPAINALFLDDTGHMWIRLSRPQSDQTITWLVLDNSGVVVAKANVPKDVRLLAERGGRAFGVETEAAIAVAWDIDL